MCSIFLSIDNAIILILLNSLATQCLRFPVKVIQVFFHDEKDLLRESRRDITASLHFTCMNLESLACVLNWYSVPSAASEGKVEATGFGYSHQTEED